MKLPNFYLVSVLAAILAVAAGPGVATATAEDIEVDLELALAVDVSGSIDDEEAMLQRAGYIAAFRHPRVLEAIRRAGLGRIAVAYYEWAGYGHMKIIAGWTLIDDKASAIAFAAKLTEEPPETASRTAIGSAIKFAVPFFEGNEYEGQRKVLDISGDGPNNWGGLVSVARDSALAEGITINGLPIMNDRPSRWGRPPMVNLDLYYMDCVIGGPGAFIVVATRFKDFASAILRKLILEIAGETPGKAPTSKPSSMVRPAAAPMGPPCDYGERLRDSFDVDDM
ncbi:MAG: DUF1194 domain-containing protein [Proteobacteria bacterium]|nr:DUF1194 domain-containing protein [Pseudomonadota bacterium]